MHAIVLWKGFRKTKWKFKMEFSIKCRTMHWWFWRIRIGKTQTYALAKQLLWSLTCQAWRTCLVVFPLLRRKWEGGLRLDSRCGQLFVQITNGTWEVNGLLLCSIFGSLTLLVQVFSPPTSVVSNRSSFCAAEHLSWQEISQLTYYTNNIEFEIGPCLSVCVFVIWVFFKISLRLNALILKYFDWAQKQFANYAYP